MSATKKSYIHYLIALILGLAIAFGLPATNGLTDIGVRTLAVTVATLYLWLTVNTHWTSILFLALLIMTGSMTANAVWAGSMGHFSVITMIVFMILNYALLQTGVINKVCNWFITRKIVRGRPYVFIYMFFASMLILGMFMDNLSLAVIYVGIAEVLCEKLGLKKGDSMYTCMFMGIMWVDVVISIASPIAHAPCLILMGMMSAQLGIEDVYKRQEQQYLFRRLGGGVITGGCLIQLPQHASIQLHRALKAQDRQLNQVILRAVLLQHKFRCDIALQVEIDKLRGGSFLRPYDGCLPGRRILGRRQQ